MKEYPYFIPGYTGFCPELREHFGQTYGYATRHIIQKRPHLKERLAPVHYKHQRNERKYTSACTHGDGIRKNDYEYPCPKYSYIQDCGEYVQPKLWASENRRKLPQEIYPCTDTSCDYIKESYISTKKCTLLRPNIRKKEYHPTDCGHRADANLDIDRKTWKEQVKPQCSLLRPNICKGEYHPTDYGHWTNAKLDADLKIRKGQVKSHRPGAIPKYTGHIPECVQPELWSSGSRRKLPHEIYLCVATPCAHVKEHYISAKECPKSNICMEEYHPVDCGHKKDTKLGIDCKIRKGQVKPHRQGGVIPKYTGHIPGMQFTFGESYGPISDRLLVKHHNRMKELKSRFFQ